MPLSSRKRRINAPNFPLPLSGSRAEPQKIREDIQVTGIFFKRAAYAAQGGAYTAPLLIAHTPNWHPSPAVAAPEDARAKLAPMSAALVRKSRRVRPD
jgi:hypothetical protein